MTFNDIVFQMFRRVIWKLLSGFLGPLGGLPGASWRPLGGLLGASWGLLGGLLGVLEVDLKLNIILEGLNFAGGPPWCCLGVALGVLGGHFGLILRFFRRPLSQQFEHAKSMIFGRSNITFYCVFRCWRPFRLHIYSEIVKSTKKSCLKRWL